MAKEDRDIQRKRKVLRHAEKTGHVARTCRYFSVGIERLQQGTTIERETKAVMVEPVSRCAPR